MSSDPCSECDGYEVVIVNGEEVHCATCSLQAEVERLRAEADEANELLERMTSILHLTANALHGGPLENGWWSWHDLPELAERLRAAGDALAAWVGQSKPNNRSWADRQGDAALAAWQEARREQ